MEIDPATLPSMAMIRVAQRADLMIERIAAAGKPYRHMSDRASLLWFSQQLEDVAMVKQLIEAAEAVVLNGRCNCGSCDICNLAAAIMLCRDGTPPIKRRVVQPSPQKCLDKEPPHE